MIGRSRLMAERRTKKTMADMSHVAELNRGEERLDGEALLDDYKQRVAKMREIWKLNTISDNEDVTSV